MSALFSPCPVGPLTLENRIVIPPMCQYAADEGKAGDWHLIHFGNLALSGAGLLIIEATAVEPKGRITPYDLGLWSDDTESRLAAALRPARRLSAMPIGIQLAHAGRKASTARPWEGGRALKPEDPLSWTPRAPSPLPFHEGDPTPEVLTQAGLDKLIEAFVASAQRAVRLGIELIELHAAHGYLLHEFLSPLSNQRTDAYGGSLENRMRFPLQVFKALRDSLPATIPLGLRLSATDWAPGGWDLDSSLILSNRVKALGAAYIHVSSGGLTPKQAMRPSPGYQVPFASAIKTETQLPTIAVGLIERADAAEAILVRGQADLIGVARAMIYNPRWPWQAAATLGAPMTIPGAAWRCIPAMSADLFSPRTP